jgi:glycosyltransferase involved in cell wall biosynthesis
MAAGVPVVAQNEWGWREMIVHGESGFLANNDFELAHFAALLAYDENLRQSIITQAHQRLRKELANPELIWNEWVRLFNSLNDDAHHSSGSYHRQMIEELANG